MSAPSSQSDEAALASAREQIALLERSLDSLQESERRARDRLAATQLRGGEVTSAHERAHQAASEAQRALDEALMEQQSAEVELGETSLERQAAEAALIGAEQTAAKASARAETLARAFDEFAGGSGWDAVAGLDGVLGPLLELIEIDPGYERAVEAAAGASLAATVVSGKRPARAVLAALRRDGGGGSVVPVGEISAASLAAPSGTRALREFTRARADAPAQATWALQVLVGKAFVAQDWESALEVALANPDLTIVTNDGDRFAPGGWRLASGEKLVSSRTVSDARGAASDAHDELTHTRERRERAEDEYGVATARVVLATTRASDALAEVQRLRREIERLSRESDELVHLSESANEEAADLAGQIITVDVELLTQRELLPNLEARREKRPRARPASRGSASIAGRPATRPGRGVHRVLAQRGRVR